MLSEEQIREAERLFRSYGYDRPLRIAPLTSEDERIFLLPATAIAAIPEAALTAQLQQALGRKVWLTSESPRWGEPEPLH